MDGFVLYKYKYKYIYIYIYINTRKPWIHPPKTEVCEGNIPN